MKVKIGDEIYSSDEQPILLILDDMEKELVSNMGDQTKICSYPDDITKPEILYFMNTDV